ncbi:protease inhibitor [Streptomyces sp. NBC_01092]|uniref:protease inhibitor n=1 Tax=Streptomyces sp. NBC_01092 TaxID=2903748 RepID=UPI00386A854D|nr:protease inhibitor [Streptomyces sp. NBC_01092]
MRNTARWAATLGLTATAVCGPLTGSALATPDAAPASLYAPSALVLTVGYGDSATLSSPARAVTLSCAPTASGTHPASGSACAELRGVNGDFDALRAREGALCTKQYDPVVVTVDGVWQGKRVSYERTFANECVKSSYGASLFAF